MLMIRIFFYCTLLVLLPQLLFAQDQDTQLRLSHELLREQIKQVQKIDAQQDQENAGLPNMVIKGEDFPVANTIEEVGRALYLSVMHKQWQAVAIYLEAYLKLEGYDQALALFAQGGLAHESKRFEVAEEKYRLASLQMPENLMIKVELARVLTELQKNRDAEDLFTEVKHQLSSVTDQSAITMINNIDRYLKGLKQRDAWQGSVAVGARYGTNINSSSEENTTTTYYYIDIDGNKIPYYIWTRESPEAIDTEAFEFEATLSKRWSMSGNHGIRFKGIAYGQNYQNNHEYNEATYNLNIGYSYQDQRNQLLLAPVFENKRYGNENYYNAWGGRAEWMHFVGRDKAFRIETEIKDIRHNDNVDYDGTENNVFMTFFKILPNKWMIFSGLDYIDHNTQEQYIGGYEQQGYRFGFSKEFKLGVNATLYSTFRWRQYDRTYAVFEIRRHDYEQNYTAVLQIPRFKFFGLTPNLMYRYIHNKSNVDWLYSYDKHQASLKLEYRF